MIAGVITKLIRQWIGTANSYLVDDLVQDTYLKLCANDFKSLREFECDHENALFGFLKVVASNVVHDHFRGHCSQKRGRGHEAECLEDVPNKGGSGESVEDNIWRGEFYCAKSIHVLKNVMPSQLPLVTRLSSGFTTATDSPLEPLRNCRTFVLQSKVLRARFTGSPAMYGSV